ncbi:terpene cyclase/mutase family protein [bacterium]|nr:terpene cyclase/mutase family protein [bacterium]
MLRLLAAIAVCLFATAVSAQDFAGPVTDTGVSADLEAVYLKGLRYLVQTQTTEGSWRDVQGAQPAVIGLAVLAMLAHGDDPNTGPYAAPIRRGLEFILRSQDERTGYIGSSMYNHGFAALALAEAYGMVAEPRLGPALRKAVDLIVASQARNPRGGWRYSPESHDADTTVSGAQLVALFAARNAGLAVPEEAIQKGIKFFQSCACAEGGFGYTTAQGPNNPRSAIGALVYTLAGRRDAVAYEKAMQFLQQDPFSRREYPFYYEYYAAQAFFHADARSWATWNQANLKYLGSTQNADGGWDSNNGRTFATAAALLSLALNYRYLPIYER